MSWHIEFSSEKFLPTLPEGCQVAPGRYGFELALWLAQGLGRDGILTGYPCEEEWGWCLAYRPSEALSLMIGCASDCPCDAGYQGRPVDWSVFIRERLSLEQRLLNRSNLGELDALGGRILALLDAERIHVAHVEM